MPQQHSDSQSKSRERHRQQLEPAARARALGTMPSPSDALRAYLPAFVEPSQHFLTYYTIGADKSVHAQQYTRGEFYELACRAASVIAGAGVEPGGMQTHFFSCNTLGDLAFRLASVMMGTTPCTVNWQADTAERVVHKVTVTGSALVLVDDETPADVVALVQAQCAGVRIFNVSALPSQPPLAESRFCGALPDDAETSRIVIFTSGTTGNPKGVRLSYRSYRCNRATFESFLQAGEGKRLVAVVVNPLHHTNSTSISDWAMRKPGSELHLVQRYSTQYWSVLARAGTSIGIEQPATEAELLGAIERRHADGGAVLVAPLVSRHFDFLDGLATADALPLPRRALRCAMEQTILLLGSAPVGPTTVGRLREHAGKLPTVRFGSTETCLQVMGTPLYLSEEQRYAAFEAGWAHTHNGVASTGYYIGRPHPPFTEVRVVRSVERGAAGYMEECADGEPGQLITRGHNIMSSYVGNEAATAAAIHNDGWYVNLGDVCFRLPSAADGEADYFWLSRDSALLIRGGANYS